MYRRPTVHASTPLVGGTNTAITPTSTAGQTHVLSLCHCSDLDLDFDIDTDIDPGMLNPRDQRGLEGLEDKIFGLGLGLVLGLMQCWPRSHEGCPRGLVVSHRNHDIIYVTFFSDTFTPGPCVSEV